MCDLDRFSKIQSHMSTTYLTVYRAIWVSLLTTQNFIAPSAHLKIPPFCKKTLMPLCNGVTHGYPSLTFLNVTTAQLDIHQTQYCFSSEIEANMISMVVEEKDLGVVFDKDLKFTSHVNQIVMKANRVLGIIKRTFASRDANTIRLLYVTLVRPILDYASTVWNPHLIYEKHS